ncbi:DUF3343 domain-containing protein [uncultured Megasphaera sp.]|uniref:DUF3343 domain-containing protein n=1 Tax=uncultured Megasphaera sp. TaxID=165188 RepID=UPI002659EBF8|nr:DUF3343 domain-containing protein [uncultured Megasphaera sp.]
MKQITDYYVLFKTHTDAMALYQAARRRGLSVKISPTPRQASVCCGVSLLVEADTLPALRQCIADTGAAYEKIVPLPRQIDAHRDSFC